MSKLKKTKKTLKLKKDDGMCSIFDMFKRQTESRKIEENKKKVLVKESIHVEEANHSSDSDVEIVDIIDKEKCIRKSDRNVNCDKRDNEKVGGKNEKVNELGSTVSNSERLDCRLSLKRKSLSLNKNCKNTISNTDSLLDSANQNDLCEKKKKLDQDKDAQEEKDGTQLRELPYYLKNFETILTTGLGDSDVSSLFNDEDHKFIQLYYSLSDNARKFYVRLFGRKFKWIPLSKVNYPEISEDPVPYLKELKNSQLIHNEDNITSLHDILETLSAPDIKSMAKLYHVAPSITLKKQIVDELIKLSQRSTVSSMFGAKGGVNLSMMKKAKSLVKGTYKLRQEPRGVFIRMIMLFSLVNTTGDEDSGNGGQSQLFHMLMVNMGRVVYPDYKIDKKHKIFKSREDVIRFENALQLESDLLHAIDSGNWSEAYNVFTGIAQELERLLVDEDGQMWNENIPEFLRSFTATSVMYRLLSQGIEILQRRKEYTEAVALIRKLLDQTSYCCSHRGYWWERLALNLDSHLKEPEKALEAVAAGLGDSHVIGGHRLALYQRAESICERPKLKLKDRLSSFHHNPIKEIPKVYLEGRILHQGVTSSGPRFLTEESYSNGNAQDMTVCGVEEFVMKHYRKKGYHNGLHAEGSIVTGLFGLFFWDILFMSVPDAFHSPYQANPLDLYSTSAFYSNRREAIDERLATIEHLSAQELGERIENTWTSDHGKLCVGLNWERLESADDMKNLVGCIGGKVLSGILGRYAKCPRHTRSGFPDLTLWNDQTGAWKICEVKGPGDRLSHKQILWIDYLLSLGVDAEVCHVKAVAAKKLRLST